MRRAAKRDANEPEVVKALEAAGWTVVRVSDAGAPDLLCARRGVLKLLEVKGPKGRLTPAQEKAFQRLAAALITVHVVRTPEEALTAVGAPVEGVLEPLTPSEAWKRPVRDLLTPEQQQVYDRPLKAHVVTPAYQREQTEAVVPKRRKPTPPPSVPPLKEEL